MFLQSIRDKSQGWFLWTIIIAICITFALWGIHSYLYSNQANNIVAVVNGTKITQQRFSEVYNQLRRQQQPNIDSSSKHTKLILKNIALQSMIHSTILTQSANKNGFNAGQDLIEKIIAKMPIFQVDGIFSKERFTQILNRMSVSLDELVSELRNNILINQVRSGIVDTSFVLPNEIDQSIQLIKQKRNFSYVTIPFRRFLPQIQLSETQIKDYYQTHQSDFEIPEKVSIQYLKLSIDDLTKQIHPSEQELKTFYQNNISTYTDPKQWKLTHLFLNIPPDANQKQIKEAEEKISSLYLLMQQGKKPEDLAKEDSSLIVQKDQTFKSETTFNTKVRSALKNLTLGKISVPIKTRSGYALIKPTAVKLEKVHPFHEVKEKVLKIYQRKKVEQQFTNLSDQLINLTYENPNSLEPAAKALSLTIQKTIFFTQKGTKEGITKNQKIIAAAFDDETLNQGNNSEPINLKDNSIVVLRINKHEPASIKSFTSVKPQIVRLLKQNEAKKQAEKISNQILENLNNHKDISLLLKKYALQWKTANDIPRYDKQIDSSILDAAFHLSRPKNLTVNTVTKLSSGDFAVISLKKVKDIEEKKTSENEYQIFKKGIENNLGLLEHQTYIDSLIQSSKIVIKKKDLSD